MASQNFHTDPKLSKIILQTDGFVSIRCLFAREDITEVEQLLDRLCENILVSKRGNHHCSFLGDMRPSHNSSDQEDPQSPDQLEIKYPASFEPRLLKTRMFRLCASFARAMGGNVSRAFDHAIIKSPRNLTETPWHQDAAFSQIRPMRQFIQASSLHFWIPLQDTSIDSGCMEFIAGSHRTTLLHHKRYLRMSGDPGFSIEPVDTSRRIACPVALGGLTIHTPHTLHYCGRNSSDTPRKAWIIQFRRFGNAQLIVKSLLGRVPRPLR